MKKMDIKEIPTENPAENPSGFGKELATDLVGFGLGAMVTHLGLEYATTEAMKGVTVKQDKVNYGVGMGVAKILVGTLMFAGAQKYIEKPHLGKKLVYGIGAGFFTSAGTDFLEAYNASIAP